MQLHKKTALVTGGARGIGAGIVRALSEAGARVMIADIGVPTRNQAKQSWRYELAQESDLVELLALDEVAATYVDVTQPSSCQAAIDDTIAHFGALDILVNNAGLVDSGRLDEFDPEVWDRIFAVNAKGIFLMCQAALPHLQAAAGGAIINTASIAGKKGYPRMAAYCGSKFAAIGITQSLAAELAPDNIRVNAICPGMVGTAMWLDHLLPTNALDSAQRQDEFEAAMRSTIPLGRAQTAADMGAAVVYLAGADNVTGIALNIAGGFEMN